MIHTHKYELFKVSIAASIQSCTNTENLKKCLINEFYVSARVAYLIAIIPGFLITLLTILSGMLGYECPKIIVNYYININYIKGIIFVNSFKVGSFQHLFSDWNKCVGFACRIC
jgi:uncharacterized metal-binding protein